MGYSPPKGRSPTCYSPVRHSRVAPKGLIPVRLACLIRAASVRSEPGSNSPSYIVAPHSEEQRAIIYSVFALLFSQSRTALSFSRSLPLFSSFPIRKKHPPPQDSSASPQPAPFTAFKDPAHLALPLPRVLRGARANLLHSNDFCQVLLHK